MTDDTIAVPRDAYDHLNDAIARCHDGTVAQLGDVYNWAQTLIGRTERAS